MKGLVYLLQVIALVITILSASHFARATEFWFQRRTERSLVPAPLSATVCGNIGSQFDLHVWAQPDPGKTLQNFSLEIRTVETPAIDIASVEVDNGVMDDRFEYVYDSTPSTGDPAASYLSTDATMSTFYETISALGFDLPLLSGPATTGFSATAALLTITFTIDGPSSTNIPIEMDTGFRGMNNVMESVTAHVADFYPAALSIHDVPADFTLDRTVDQEDLSIWIENFATPFGSDCRNGDADFDGDVDGADLLVIQRNVQGAGFLQASTHEVPEPTTLGIASVIFCGILLFRVPGKRTARSPLVTFLAALTVSLTFHFPTVQAQQFAEWIDNVGFWSEASNWSTQIVPDATQQIDSAVIANGGLAIINSPVNNIVNLEVSAGELNLDANFDLGVTGQATVESNGIVRIAANSKLDLINSSLDISGGQVTGLGTINVAGEVLNEGEIAPGLSQDFFGALTIDGDYSQTNTGTLLLDFRGSEFDQLVVNGAADIAGPIVIDYGDLVTDTQGPVALITADVLSLEQNPDQIVFLSAVTGGEACDTVYRVDDPNSDLVRLYSDTVWRGDMNLDGSINSGDIQLFAEAMADPAKYRFDRWNTPNALGRRYNVFADHMGDVDGFLGFNFDDAEAFADKIDVSPSVIFDAIAALQQPVPEPATANLLLIACLGLGASRWNGNRSRY